MKAKEREAAEAEAEAEAEGEHDDQEEDDEHEDHDEQDNDHEREDKERVGKEAERVAREAAEQAARDIEDELDAVVGTEASGGKSRRKGAALDGEGDTTVEEEDPPAPRRPQRGTGPPKRSKERKSDRQKEREQPEEMDQGPPTPPRIPTPPALHLPAKTQIPGADTRSPITVPVSPNPTRRTLPSLQSPERTSERNLPLPVPIANQRSPRLPDAHPLHLPRPQTPPERGAILAPMGGWQELHQPGALVNTHTSPGRTHHALPEHQQREFPHPAPNITPSVPSPHTEHPPRKPRKPEMHPFRTSAPSSWSQNQVQTGQGATLGQTGHQGPTGYQVPIAGQAGFQQTSPPAPGQGSFQTLTGPYQAPGYPASQGQQNYQSPPQTFQPAISPTRTYQTSPRQSAGQVYHSPPHQTYHSPPAQMYQPLPGPGQTYHNPSPSRQPYLSQPSSYQGPAAQVFPPPPLYVPPPTTFPLELHTPDRTTFQDGPAFSNPSPSRLPMLGERGRIGEGGIREWDRLD
ncbi:hypothetical protein BN14_07669 [Rhizoctonia solani AG-1 IB]|uniref:Uncharacterized protein n=1 Tax=Thanatephorus cucumeris (strain AG1-IB / isolate 7/3/14) TaxID=1108050 RepID=M5C3J3_THACB|nr:hypothetical protein BN14_07669 [Rhizoctonia solani AG-1 IB]